MANLVYKRVSTDQQSTARQNLVLDEAGIEDPVVFEGAPAPPAASTHSSARSSAHSSTTPGDTVHLSEMCRLVRGTGHILDVLDVHHRDQVALRIHDGAFSVMVLTARHPRTGELLSTVKSMVQTSPPTYEGLRAAEAKGSKGGRRPAVAIEKTGDVRTAYLGADRLPPSPATTASAAAPSAPPSLTSCPTATPPRRAPRPRSRRSLSTCRASRRLPPRRRSGARRAGRARPKHAIRHRV
ncbi:MULTISPECIES: recombinase family protein [unclassified Streptomyces]|uniref:recombinase family protein n=1 Tax=unclassified Streptomyces TaxID=2593676 RepID=UPI0022529429|nr:MULTISPECIES: recombinase family protein [unclassified Streptomyces]MCX5103837.1 recombinase family protein [Streptomyces sp. NBC_00439]WSC32067.1 recombinase family protein [Streptomyces sp. NBC_01768]WSX06104.1 recombinase family protein [Streptomyces sp. NBC_00987]